MSIDDLRSCCESQALGFAGESSVGFSKDLISQGRTVVVREGIEDEGWVMQSLVRC